MNYLLEQSQDPNLIASTVRHAAKLLSFYKQLLPLTHYYENLNYFVKAITDLIEGNFLPFEKQQNLLMLVSQCQQALKEIDYKTLLETHRQEQLTANNFANLPLNFADISEWNNVEELPEIATSTRTGYSFSYKLLQQTAKAGKQLATYFRKHPVQAVTMGLAYQVTASAAFETRYNQQQSSLRLGDNAEPASSLNALSNSNSVSFKQQELNSRAIRSLPINNNEFQIGINSTNAQVSPSPIAVLKNGNFVVVWAGIGNLDNSAEGIYAQLFDANAQKMGNEVLINTITANSQINPAVTPLEDGGVVIAWQTYLQSSASFEIASQIFDSGLNKLYGETQINSYTSNDQTLPSVTYSLDGGYVAAWQSNLQDGDNFGIFSQRMYKNNTKNGLPFQVNNYATNYQIYGRVNLIDNEVYLYSWTSQGQDGSNDGVFARIFNFSLPQIYSEFLINGYTQFSQISSTVSVLVDKRLLFGWEDTARDGSGYGCYGQLFNSSGSIIGSDFRFHTFTSDQQLVVKTTALDDGGFFGVWESNLQDGSGAGIFGQQFNSLAQKIGPEFQININFLFNQASPSIEKINNGQCLVTWRGQLSSGGSFYTFGRVINTKVIATNLNQNLTYTEDTPQQFNQIEISTPPYAPNITASLDLNPPSAGILSTGTSNSVTASYNSSSGRWQASGLLDDVKTLLNSIVFTPAPNFNQNITINVLLDNNINPLVSDNITLTGISVNDEPTLSLTPQTDTYTEKDSTGILLNQNITISDVDNSSLAGATVAIAENYVSSEDRLVFSASGSISGNFNVSSGTLHLSGSDSTNNYKNILQSLRYVNLNQYSPSPASRVITFTINDGQFNSNRVNQTVSIILVNDPPTLTVTNTDPISYVVGISELGVNIASDIQLIDDGNDILNASVAFTAGWIPEEDFLTFNNQNNIIGSFDQINGILNLFGISRTNLYQAALQSIKYANSNESPTLGSRTISILACDDSATSACSDLITKTINVVDEEQITTSPPPPSSSSSFDKKLIGIIAGAGGFALICIPLGIFLAYKKSQRMKKSDSLTSAIALTDITTDIKRESTKISYESRPTAGDYVILTHITKSEADELYEKEQIDLRHRFNGQVAIDERIGGGFYSTAYYALNRMKGEFAAAKLIEGDKKVEDSLYETAVLLALQNKENIVQFIAASEPTFIPQKDAFGKYVNVKTINQVTTLGSFGDGKKAKKKLSNLNDSLLKKKYLVKIIADALNGLKNIHETAIDERYLSHLDIKPENIFITMNGYSMIGDLGCALSSEKTTNGLHWLDKSNGDLRYFSPQRLAFHRKKYLENGGSLRENDAKQEVCAQFDGAKADAWAIGITAWELATGQENPFTFKSIKERFETCSLDYIKAEVAKMITVLEGNPLLTDFKEEISVIKGLIEPDADKRLTVSDALAIMKSSKYKFKGEELQYRFIYLHSIKTQEEIEEEKLKATHEKSALEQTKVKDEFYDSTYQNNDRPLPKSLKQYASYHNENDEYNTTQKFDSDYQNNNSNKQEEIRASNFPKLTHFKPAPPSSPNVAGSRDSSYQYQSPRISQ